MQGHSNTKTLKSSATNNSVTNTDKDLQSFLLWLTKWRFTLFACLGLLYCFGVNGHWRLLPDSTAHFNYALEISGQSNHYFSDLLFGSLQPGLAYMFLGMIGLFGQSFIWGMNLGLLSISLFTLFVSYHFFMLITNDQGKSVFLTFLLGITEHHYLYTFEILTDMPFSLGMILSLYGWQRFKYISPKRIYSLTILLIGISIMVLFRSVFLIALISLLIATVYELYKNQQKRLLTFIASIAAIVGVSFIAMCYFDLINLPIANDIRLFINGLIRILIKPNDSMLFTNCKLLLCEVMPEVITGQDLGDIAGLPFGLTSVYLCLRLFNKEPLWGILFFCFIAQWIFFQTDDRYVLPLIPLVVLAVWFGLQDCKWIKNGYRGFSISLTILCMLFISNIIADGKIIHMQRQHNFYASYKNGVYLDVQTVSRWISQNTPNKSVILCSDRYPMEYSWMGKRSVTNVFPEHVVVDDNYDFFVLLPLNDLNERIIRSRKYVVGDKVSELTVKSKKYSIHKLYIKTKSQSGTIHNKESE